MRKLSITALIVIVLAAASWFWWSSDSGEVRDTLVLHGNVDIRQVSLAFDGNGRVVELFAEEGDFVKAGAVLGVLDTQELALQAEQAQAQIEVQKQTVARLHNGSRPQEVAQARSRLSAAQAESVRAELEFNRLKDIAGKTQGLAVSQQDLDRAKANVEVTRAKVKEEQEALKLAEMGPRQEDVAGAEAQLKSLQAQLALLKLKIDRGELKSPADAIVRSRLVEPGDMVTPQRPVFALALPNPKWVRAYVSETDLGKVVPGLPASVVTDTYPDQLIEGKVGYISSVAEFTPKSVQTEELRTSLVYEVRIVVKDEANQLRLGQPATVNLAAVESK